MTKVKDKIIVGIMIFIIIRLAFAITVGKQVISLP